MLKCTQGKCASREAARGEWAWIRAQLLTNDGCSPTSGTGLPWESRRCPSVMCPQPAWGDAHTAPALTRDRDTLTPSQMTQSLQGPLHCPLRASLGSFIRSRGECSKGKGDFLLLAAGWGYQGSAPALPSQGLAQLRLLW